MVSKYFKVTDTYSDTIFLYRIINNRVNAHFKTFGVACWQATSLRSEKALRDTIGYQTRYCMEEITWEEMNSLLIMKELVT